MAQDNDWIAVRLAAAVAAVEADHKSVPESVIAELKQQLEGPLQEQQRPADLQALVKRLAIANGAQS